jgi:hypothetical protein
LILGEGGEEKIVPVMKENGTSSSLWFRWSSASALLSYMCPMTWWKLSLGYSVLRPSSQWWSTY